MKKKIAILGSTGSIGKSTFEIIKKDKKNFDVILLSTNRNIRELSKQQKILNLNI
jgi:1-deoxy-D-xylulose-5-phosphate reductoisomerase